MNLKPSILSAKSLAFGVSGVLVSATAFLASTSAANASAIIYNTGDASTATIALGINDLGNLNVIDPTGAIQTSNGSSGAFGVATKYVDNSTWKDGISPGCLCEGWGLSGSIGGTNYTGNASREGLNGGIRNLMLSSFVTDATAGKGTSAVSTAALTNLLGLSISQDYRVAAGSSNLFEDRVTITNTTGSAIDNLRYVRAMDWDIPPSEFNELVTIGGVKTTSQLELSHDNGFSDTNPLALTSGAADTTSVDFTKNGPRDHGAYFKFNFGTLASGASQTFSVFYGAAPDEAAAKTALGETGIELFSFGQSNAAAANPATYIFGFKGVGGVAVVPDPTPTIPGSDPTAVPEPFTIVGSLIGGTAAFRMRKKLQAADKA